MSRCFPFTPRGYEKKHRQEEGDLLKEVRSLHATAALYRYEKRKERRKNIKRKRKTRRREKVKKKGIKTEVMGNTEKRKRKRINTGTRTERRTRTKRRTRIRIKRKAASLRRQELPFHLGLLVEESFMREMNIKIDILAWRKGKMNIKIDTLSQRKPNSPISFMSSMERSCPLRPASLQLRQRTQNLCRSWAGGSEMKRRVRKVSWRRDFQLSGKEMKNQIGWASKLLVILLTRKRTKRKDLITIRWMRKHLGVNRELELMQYLTVILQWQKAILEEFPDHWKKMLGRRKRKNRDPRNDVMTNQERKTRIKKGKSTVMESRKTRKKRRKRRKRRQRIKVNTRKARKINQKTTIRMILLFLVTINFLLYPTKTVLVRPPWESSKRERMLKLMVSCMRVKSGLLNCCGPHPLSSQHRMERKWTHTQKQACFPLLNRKLAELFVMLKWKTRSTR